jgi:hypothetical protein
MLPTLLFSGILLASASAKAPGTLSPAVVRLAPQATSISNQSVTPAAITFTATSPDNSPVVSGSSSALVGWSIDGNTNISWTLSVSAPATFGSCPTVPASAVTVSCGTVSGGTGGVCGGSRSLSTTPTQIANGAGASGNRSYSASLSFTLQDSWKYIASSSCSVTVTYSITAN